jgi:malate synthase
MSLPPELDVQILGPDVPGARRVLTDEALSFVQALTLRFRPRIRELLIARKQRQKLYDDGALPDFLPETSGLREGDWRVAPLPRDLLDRRVEITGPVDRKMVINALNSGARVFMADFEDATSPTWATLVAGQANLIDAVRRRIDFTHPDTGKRYALGEQVATLMVRPRGLHLPEPGLLVAGEPVPACLFDFGLYAFHNAVELVERGTGPYFYLPKLEHHLEAQLWDEVFVFTQQALGLPLGTIKATVLIETLPAAFQMDEILHALRRHSAGLNCGRWDYIFSFIKTLRSHGDRLLPERGAIGMTQPCMRAYTRLAVKTCHRRGVHAMGGMAAQIPLRHDPVANERALAKVRQDKLREVADGHDGTWVAHPGLVPIALEAMSFEGDNQLHVLHEDLEIVREDLLELPKGERTEAGLRQNLSVGLRYLASWLDGQGCVPLDGLMEDAATAEISRTQLWQWVHHGATLDDGRQIDGPLVQALLAEELEAASARGVQASDAAMEKAADLLLELVLADDLAPFLTLYALPHLA